MPPLDSKPRHAAISILGIVLAIGLGLATRRLGFLAFTGKYPGDALWALMMFFLVGLVRPRASTARVGIVALGISYAIEVSQLYEPRWLVSVRTTTLGHLVLGSKFHVVDLVAYTVGVAVGVGLELLIRRRRGAA